MADSTTVTGASASNISAESSGTTESKTESQCDVEKRCPIDTEDTGPPKEPKPNDPKLGPDAECLDIVTWDGPSDLANPLNWRFGQKVGNVLVVSLITLITPLASSMFAPGVPQLVADFRVINMELSSFVVSIYLLGFAFGPLICSPLSELYGRLPVYFSANLLFIVFTISCALSTDFNMLMAFRFLEGCAGSAPLTLGGGTISDLIPRESRGAGAAIFALGPLLGPVIGPVGGGFLSQAMGWRWVFWLLAIVAGSIQLLAFVFMQETCAAVLLERKAKRLRKETGNHNLRTAFTREVSRRKLFSHAIIRPMKMLLDPCVLFPAIFMAITYGYLYLLFTTIPTVFTGTYGFTTGTVGLAYIGLGIGFLVGVGICGLCSDKIVKKKSARGGNKPEYRLSPHIMMPGALCIPVGLFMYGWSAHEKIHWIVPIIGTTVTGSGILMCFMPIQAYMVDAFTTYAASALAANVVMRSVVGAVLPLAGPSMYSTLGLGWGNSLLGFIALAMCPIPLVLYHSGERIRMHSAKRRSEW